MAGLGFYQKQNMPLMGGQGMHQVVIEKCQGICISTK